MTLPARGWRLGLLAVLLALATPVPGAPRQDSSLPAAGAARGAAGAAGRAAGAGSGAAPAAKAASEPILRVLLRQDTRLDLAAVSTPLRLADEQGRPLLQVSPGEALTLQLTAAGIQAELEPAAAGEPSQARGRTLALPAGGLRLEPIAGERRDEPIFTLQNNAFRGRLLVRSSGERLQAINLVGVESYLPSVVGSEMPASWPQAALRAQAVAARTYALSQRRPAAPFDLTATVASQVYKGVAAETPSTREAVASTRARVLTFGDGLINAVFHSSSGGNTESSGEIWRKQLPYLVSVPDFDDTSPVRTWQVRFDPDQLRRSFPETGGVSEIQVLGTSPSGRIRRVQVSGPAGTRLFSGVELRQRLGLRSTLVQFRLEAAADARPPALPRAGRLPVPPPPLEAAAQLPDDLYVDPASGAPVATAAPTVASGNPAWAAAPVSMAMPVLVVDGRGFGHGVGMSQWGAYALALRGRNYEQILRHYYRGARVEPYLAP